MKQYAVLGLGRFGLKVAKTLSEKGCEVLAVDTEKEKIDAVRDFVSHAIQITSNSEEVYKAIGLDKVDVAIVGVGASNVEASILVTALLRKVGVKDINLRSKYNVNVLVVKKADSTVDIPGPDFIFSEGDQVILVGKDEDLEKLSEEE